MRDYTDDDFPIVLAAFVKARRDDEPWPPVTVTKDALKAAGVRCPPLDASIPRRGPDDPVAKITLAIGRAWRLLGIGAEPMRPDERQSVLEEGWDAFQDGREPSANPYPVGTPAHGEWLSAWTDAESHFKDRERREDGR